MQGCGHGLAVRRQVVDVSHFPSMADVLEPTAITSNRAGNRGVVAAPYVLGRGSGVPDRGSDCSTEGN